MLNSFLKNVKILHLGRWCHPEYISSKCTIDSQYLKTDFATLDNCHTNNIIDSSNTNISNITNNKIFKEPNKKYNNFCHSHNDELLVYSLLKNHKL